MGILLDVSPLSEVVIEPEVETFQSDYARFEAEIGFPGDYRLSVNLAVDFSGGDPIWQHYSFHYASRAGSCVFRYDNARHYPALPFFPHHKHVGLLEEVEPSPRPSIRQVADDIADSLP